ncbi:TfdA family taurine catabolism dioxygenase TauD [Mycobacterium sp. BK086]|uniref:TauD/TfdA family dioxygenase n=1 Tax=Mycobacterium sp. BK086 TaxID=2512165 RepID=UPI00105EBD68|nr:TauD/TfdA family dioxygenase [Mycobacterium sp. BK086]TDO06597.1 TfdA family taurine catabolism dioxygenase TauD [Mycobacterium sp. BK086]
MSLNNTEKRVKLAEQLGVRISAPRTSAEAAVANGLAVVTLTDSDRLVLEGLASELRVDAELDPAQFVEAAHVLSRGLPASVVTAEYRLEALGSALLLQNMPIGPIGPTPSDPLSAGTHRTVLARAAAVVMSGLGHLCAFRGECDGRLIQTLVPVKQDAAHQMSTGRVDLMGHSEQAFNPTTCPDFVGLAGFRGDPNAATLLMSARTLIDALPSRTVRLLHEPVFYTTVDASFIRLGVADERRGPMAVLAGSYEDPVIRFDDDLQTTDSPDHRDALEQLRNVWRHERLAVVLGPGDMLIIDNSRIVHGRTEYYPLYDGGDRWLARLQVLKSLSVSRFARRRTSPVIELNGV